MHIILLSLNYIYRWNESNIVILDVCIQYLKNRKVAVRYTLG